jgi:hypothetical protein
MKSERSARYIRPRPAKKLAKGEREQLLNDYLEHYRTIAAASPDLLNQKMSRDIFSELLQMIGGILIEHSGHLAVQPGSVRDFLQLNTLPPSVDQLLPPDFRAFCLALNALKQWVSAEQQATDRYLLGGNARGELRAAAGSCIMTGQSLEGGCELHHPVRDGRPPIPLSHQAHDQIENQQSQAEASSDPKFALIVEIKRQTHNSWINLRKGCLDLMERKVKFGTTAVRDGARAFARKVKKETDLDFDQILEFLDEHDLGTK